MRLKSRVVTNGIQKNDLKWDSNFELELGLKRYSKNRLNKSCDSNWDSNHENLSPSSIRFIPGSWLICKEIFSKYEFKSLFCDIFHNFYHVLQQGYLYLTKCLIKQNILKLLDKNFLKRVCKNKINKLFIIENSYSKFKIRFLDF